VNVAILIPTLGRSHVLGGLVDNIRENTPEGCFRIYFVLDTYDRESWDVCMRLLDEAPGGDIAVVHTDGTYPEKTNVGFQFHRGEQLVLPTADDVRFHPNWLQAALSHFERGAQVVGTNDLSPATAKGTHATMPIVRRSYIEDPGAVWGEPGKVFHEGYHHNFVETELWQLAEHRGVAVFEPRSVIEHLHPSWGTRDADDTDRKGNARNFKADRETFNARRDAWLAS